MRGAEIRLTLAALHGAFPIRYPLHSSRLANMGKRKKIRKRGPGGSPMSHAAKKSKKLPASRQGSQRETPKSTSISESESEANDLIASSSEISIDSAPPRRTTRLPLISQYSYKHLINFPGASFPKSYSKQKCMLLVPMRILSAQSRYS